MNSLRTQIHQTVFNLRDSIQNNTAAREATELAKHSISNFLANIPHKSGELAVGVPVFSVNLLLIIPKIGIICMTELRLDSDFDRSQWENLLLVHSLAQSLGYFDK